LPNIFILFTTYQNERILAVLWNPVFATDVTSDLECDGQKNHEIMKTTQKAGNAHITSCRFYYIFNLIKTRLYLASLERKGISDNRVFLALNRTHNMKQHSSEKTALFAM